MCNVQTGGETTGGNMSLVEKNDEMHVRYIVAIHFQMTFRLRLSKYVNIFLPNLYQK